MSDLITSPAPDPCGCGGQPPESSVIFNRPGLDRLQYRAGTHGSFFRRMLAALPAQASEQEPDKRPLAALSTRSAQDASIALLDAWAVVGDVLTFYQERIANEGFLSTATERRSVLELARTIGYELRPGVAATAFLAFTVDGSPTSPPRVTIPAGTKIQSMPAQQKLPQTFETSADFTARAAWNVLPPRKTQPQTITDQTEVAYLQGHVADLKPGALVLIVSGPEPFDRAQVKATMRWVTRVSFEDVLQRTRIDLVLQPAELPPFIYHPPNILATPIISYLPFTRETVKQYVMQGHWRESDLSDFAGVQGWDEDALVADIEKEKIPPGFRQEEATRGGVARELRAKASVAGPGPNPQPVPDVEYGIYQFTVDTAAFGSSAPPYASSPLLPNSTTHVWPTDWDKDTFAITMKTGTKDTPGRWFPEADFFLERVVSEVQPGTWIIVEDRTLTGSNVQVYRDPYRVTDRFDRAVADFSISGRATGVQVEQADGNSVEPDNLLDRFIMRSTTIRAGSQPMALAMLPISAPIGQGTDEEKQLTLDVMVVGLKPGQPIIVTGERNDLSGVVVSEVTFIRDIIHNGGYTTLFFDALQYTYVRSTVTVNANVVAATHGETVPREVLGGGDGSQANQRFQLKKPPLTYVAAPVPSGGTSTLGIRVNGVEWEEAPSLFGLDHRAQRYVVRIDNDAKPTVIFGDGEQGARPPSGTENIVASYRSGIGSSGLVPAGSLSLLQTRPLGVRNVTNPVAASGAADPERLEGARTNAPNTVQTLDRVVSIADYEAFARGFSGIGKAQAIAIWMGETHVAHLTVAGLGGVRLDPATSTYQDLVAAIAAAADPVQPFLVAPHQPLYFRVTAGVVVDPHYDSDQVVAAVATALQAAYSFDRRDFGQAVTAAGVITTIQQTEGVVATDLRQLYRSDDDQGPQQTQPVQVLIAEPAHLVAGVIQPGQLLLLSPLGAGITAVAALT